MVMDAEQDFSAVDNAFAALIQEWQVAIYEQGESGTTVRSLSKHLHGWLQVPVSTRDQTNPLVEKIVPERLSARIADVARDSGISRAHMIMAVLAMIERLLQAMPTPEAARAATLWTQTLASSPLAQMWLAIYTPPKRGFDIHAS